jgi:hypothetical protein
VVVINADAIGFTDLELWRGHGTRRAIFTERLAYHSARAGFPDRNARTFVRGRKGVTMNAALRMQ